MHQRVFVHYAMKPDHEIADKLACHADFWLKRGIKLIVQCKPGLSCHKCIPEILNPILLTSESSHTLSYMRENQAKSLGALLAVDLDWRDLP